MENLPRGEYQIRYRENLSHLDKAVKELWKLYDNTEDEKLKIKIVAAIEKLSMTTSKLMDSKHLFEPRTAIHNEIRKPYLFESDRAMYRRPTIDYTLFEDIFHEQNVHKSDKNSS